MAKKTEKSGRSFEDDLKRLEEIVSDLESGAPIEKALILYQEGMKLSGYLESRLTDIERKVYHKLAMNWSESPKASKIKPSIC